MGLIIDINDYLSIEMRRDSFALMTGMDDNDVDEIAEYLELDYRYVFPLKEAIAQVECSERFKTWLAKKEGR